MKLQLTKTAFWDTDIDTINETEHADFIISRVFQFGLLPDLFIVLKYYNKQQIKHSLTTQRGIDEKALNLARILDYI